MGLMGHNSRIVERLQLNLFPKLFFTLESRDSGIEGYWNVVMCWF